MRLLGPEPYADREVRPTTPWNYALDLTRPLEFDRVQRRISATGRRIETWQIDRHAAGPVPSDFETGEPEAITLVPYGSTLLRVGEFPVVR